MKTKLFLIFLWVFALSACDKSCDKSGETLDGDWGDTIQFSDDHVEIPQNGGCTSIASKGWWSLTGIKDGEQWTTVPYKDGRYIGDLFDFQWIHLSKPSAKTLEILADSNTGEERSVVLSFESGDSFVKVTITQKGIK